MALKQYFNIVLVPLKFIPKRTASFWQTIKIPNRFVLKICTGGFADYICHNHQFPKHLKRLWMCKVILIG